MMTWAQAIAAATAEDPRPLYILRGDEQALVSRFLQAVQARQEALVQQPVALERYWFDDDGVAKALHSCRSIGLFGTADIVVLMHCGLFGGTTKLKVDAGDLEAYLEHPILDRTLIITVPADAWDERRKLTKLAKSHPVVDCTTPPPKAGGVVSIAEHIARSKGITIAPLALQELIRRTRGVTVLERELEKLLAYAKGSSISEADVEQLVSKPLEDNVFAWIAAVVEGRAKEAFDSIAVVLQTGNDAMGLLALIARQVRLMWFAAWGASQHQSQTALAGQIGAHPYALKVALSQAQGVSLDYLETLLTLVADAEYAVKSGRREVGQALDFVVMSCLAIKAGRARAR